MSDQLSKKLLTPELRVQFQALGEKSVQRDVSNHNYGRADKHRAALYWLAEVRQARMTREKHMFWVAVGGGCPCVNRGDSSISTGRIRLIIGVRLVSIHRRGASRPHYAEQSEVLTGLVS